MRVVFDHVWQSVDRSIGRGHLTFALSRGPGALDWHILFKNWRNFASTRQAKTLKGYLQTSKGEEEVGRASLSDFDDEPPLREDTFDKQNNTPSGQQRRSHITSITKMPELVL